ncbi:MAG: hypothetical protein COU25_03420 [Candidatus Levybacteria bacterium CG10_big_fil_rev_8_21_14_0_10_35_13]|nr:MAG: hypothetical protein COU25_03420 [Candidatus Levybacteria bacterium CG10_big_fil_rev_8_21_14_0_10_35_13]
MDDTAQKSQGQNQSGDQKQQSQQPIVSAPGGIGKEAERPVSDFVRLSETPLVLDREVSEAGVEVVSEKPNLTAEHQQIGIRHSGENAELSIKPTQTVKLPITREEAEAEIAKDKGNVNSDIGEHKENIYTSPSALFLARLVIKHLKRIGKLFSKN